MTENCLTELHAWFVQNVLQLNDDTTIFMNIDSNSSYVHNAAARRIAQKWKYGHITHIRRALHWLPVKQCISAYILIQGRTQLVPSLRVRTDHTLQTYKKVEIIM